MEQYEKLLSELRHRYELKYNKKLDDDLLYLIVRMNEMEASTRKEIRNVQRPIMKSKWELFLYGFAGNTLTFILATIIIVLSLIILLK